MKKIAWNKGKTKETDHRLKLLSEKLKTNLAGKRKDWMEKIRPNMKGENNPAWKGGEIIDGGYKKKRMSNKKYRAEHILMMEEHLGRKIERWENVHHKNGDKLDNRLENLEVLSTSEHAKVHGFGQRI